MHSGVEQDGIKAVAFQGQSGKVGLDPGLIPGEFDQAQAAVPPTVMPSISKVG